MNAGQGYRATAAALFEAAMLVRCTGVYPDRLMGMRGRTGSGVAVNGDRHTHPVIPPPSVAPAGCAEFGRAEAAMRLVDLLTAADCQTRVEPYTAGNRHRYEIHRVSAPAEAFALLAEAWRAGYAELCARPDRHLSVPRRRYVTDLAAAAWRGALLCTGPVRGTSPGVPVTDLDTATALLRAGRCLDVPVRLVARPRGRYVLAPPVGAARVRLAELADSVADARRPVAA